MAEARAWPAFPIIRDDPFATPLAAAGRPRSGWSAAIALIVVKWGAIHWFALGDTDDNLRIAAGQRLAARAGLVRPAAISARSAGRREHPLVAAGRPADRRDHPAAAAVRRLRARREGGGGDRAAAAAGAGDGRDGAGGAAAGRARAPSRSARCCCCAGRARCSCSCRCASIIMAGSSPCWRWRWPAAPIPTGARGGVTVRAGDGAVAGRSGWRCCPIWRSPAAMIALRWVRRSRRGGAAARAMRRRSRRDRRPAISRFASYDNRAAGVRCAVAGVAVGGARRRAGCSSALAAVRIASWRVRLALAAAAAALLAAGFAHCLAALPVAARGRLARARSAVAVQRARGQAGLCAWLAHLSADRRAAAGGR